MISHPTCPARAQQRPTVKALGAALLMGVGLLATAPAALADDGPAIQPASTDLMTFQVISTLIDGKLSHARDEADEMKDAYKAKGHRGGHCAQRSLLCRDALNDNVTALAGMAVPLEDTHTLPGRRTSDSVSLRLVPGAVHINDGEVCAYVTVNQTITATDSRQTSTQQDHRCVSAVNPMVMITPLHTADGQGQVWMTIVSLEGVNSLPSITPHASSLPGSASSASVNTPTP
ncbi:hypothetical protein E3E12_08535 [Formicincola oecophyllae]|uniref:Uncharacterized protein n=1 Tax=Formicincola oecophyllae TaxID=2558361 RepID=A0A4Y6UCN6_9PROT|nr:hypothetical protein [Formicincola oecophyllae]QDH14226.1 hypothetical protein E3E12_08535 [Formicincola oecophyllae]